MIRNINSFISKYRVVLLLGSTGILMRLVFALFFNHVYDFENIVAIAKSVADTGNVTEGFFVLKQHGLEVQLYGKIYYQIVSLWMQFLQSIKILNIEYLFDVKSYDGTEYMVNYGSWHIPMFQTTAIKLLQLFYDVIFVIFLYKSARIINPKYASTAVIFWALNPLIIFVGYAMFQADLAMLASLTAGIYFSLKALYSGKEDAVNKVIALMCLALGAIIKQVPLLIIPVLLILFIRNIKGLISYPLVAIFSYIVLSQPWAQDTIIIKKFFLTSAESLALLNFQLNHVPVFFLLYGGILTITFLKRSLILNEPLRLVGVVVLTFCSLYLAEDQTLFFPQFHIWIMPFILLLSLRHKEYVVFLAAPLIGFLKRAFVDGDFLSGSLAHMFGPTMGSTPQYDYLIKYSIPPVLIDRSLTGIVIFIYILLAITLTRRLLSTQKAFPEQTKDNYPFLSVRKVIVFILMAYTMLVSIDYLVKSKYVEIIDNFSDSAGQRLIPGDGISMKIDNPQRLTFNAIELKTSRKSVNYYDNVVLRFRDPRTNEVFFEQKVLDNLFPEHEDRIIIALTQGVNRSSFNFQLVKDLSKNEVFAVGSKIKDPPISEEKWGPSSVKMQFIKLPIQIAFRGQYSGFISSFLENMHENPKFYVSYATVVGLHIVVVTTLIRWKSVT